jgi:hypothetical protein
MTDTLDTAPVLPGTEAAAGATAPPAAPAASRARRARGAKKDTAPKKVGRPSNDDKLGEKIAELYVFAAGAVMFKSPELAGKIAEAAPELGASWVKLANEYPSVRKMLERMATTSAVGAFLAAHLAVFGDDLMRLVMPKITGATAPGDTPDAPEAGAQVIGFP